MYCLHLLWLQTIHCLYVFNGKGACLYYREWNRPHSTLADNPSEDRKLLFGLHFSLKKLIEKLSPSPYVVIGLSLQLLLLLLLFLQPLLLLLLLVFLV